MSKSYFFFLAVVALTSGIVSAATEEEIMALKAVVRPMLEDCAQEFGTTRDKVIAAKEAGNLDALDSCFYECLFKKIGFIGANGLFDSTVAVEKKKKYFKDEADTQKFEQTAKICTSVNEQSVSDGVKACERSKLLLGCLHKEKALSLF